MEIPPFVKSNWPYIVGGVVGIGAIIYLRSSADTGAAGSGLSDTAALIAQNQSAQLAANAQQATIDAQNAVVNQRMREADQAYALGVQTLANAQFSNNNAAQVAYADQTAEVAAALGTASQQVVNALNTPAIAAMNYAAQENAATVAAAGTAAAASYVAQASTIQSSMAIPTVIASTIGTQGQNAQVNAGSSGSEQALISGLGSLAMAFVSDETVKINVAPTERDSVADIAALEFVGFDYDAEKVAPGSHDVGVLAQRAREINPQWAVKVEGSPYLHIHLPNMLMSALHAIKTLQARVIELEQKS